MKTIRELRQERDWTQYELAMKVGVHPQAVYLWESGKRLPQVPQLRKLGRLFEQCSDEIVLLEPVKAASRTKRRYRSGQDVLAAPAAFEEQGDSTGGAAEADVD